MDQEDFIRTLAKHLTLGDLDAAREDLRTYTIRSHWALQNYLAGKSDAEREQRTAAGLPAILAPIEGGGVADPIVDRPAPRRKRVAA